MNSHFQEICLDIIPIKEPASGERFFVVLFETAEPSGDAASQPQARAKGKPHAKQGVEERELERLRQELASTKAYLHSIIEEHNASNEELKAANEEIVSSNEELQSTNEELETAKEELQATNEELTTVNEELRNRIQVATRLSDDLANLIDSVNIPTLVLGDDLHVRRFSPSAAKLLNLIPTDLGRPISNIKFKIQVPDLEAMLVEVLGSSTPQEREVQDEDGRWYLLSIRPYRTLDTGTIPHQLTKAAHVINTVARTSPHIGGCVRRNRIRKTGLIQAATGKIHRPLATTESRMATPNQTYDHHKYLAFLAAASTVSGPLFPDSTGVNTLLDWLMIAPRSIGPSVRRN